MRKEKVHVKMKLSDLATAEEQFSLCGVSGSSWAQGMFEPSEHLWWGGGLILNAISPLLPSFWGFSFAPGHEVSFLVGSNIPLSTVDQQRVVILEFLQEKMSARPASPPSCYRLCLI